MINSYDPTIYLATHAIRVTIMRFDYVGHFTYTRSGNVKGIDLLGADCFDYDYQEDIDSYLENDCELSYDEENDVYSAVLTNSKGEKTEIKTTPSGMKDMVVAIEFVDVKSEDTP